MTHDRAHSEQFHLTHQYLADMMGVGKSAVTIAAVALLRIKLISYTRGEISVLDRRELESASRECYRSATENHQR